MAGITKALSKVAKKASKGKGGKKAYADMTPAERKAAYAKYKKEDDIDVDAMAAEKVEEARSLRSKREANEKLGDKAKAKAKAKDSGDISEVVVRKDRKPNTTEKQTGEERLINATGAISAMLTKAGPKPLSMDKYRSLPTRARDAFGRQASKDYDRGIITKSEYETIIKRIEEAELYKGVRAMEQGRANKKAKPVTLAPAMDFSKGGTPIRKMYNKGGYANCGASVPAAQGRKK